MAKVFLVTDGDYSDYRVISAFSKEEDANRYAEMIGAGVEFFELDKINLNNIPDGYKFWECTMLKNGDVKGCCKTEPPDDDRGLCRKTKYYDSITCSVLAVDDVHAIKITNEIRTRIIASGIWENQYSEFKIGKQFTLIKE